MERADKDLAFMLQFENVAWYQNGAVRILDRRIYPEKTAFVTCHTHEEVAEAIRDMVTQSAGPYTAAGMGMALAAYECREFSQQRQIEFLEKAAYRLANARPTTANRMTQVVDRCLQVANETIRKSQKIDEAILEHTVHAMNRRYERIGIVAKYLVDLFPKGGHIMTQCFGETIVGMMLKEAKSQNNPIKLFCPETRPYLQGARLTASVAYDQGFDVTVITDNMPAFTMKTKGIDVFTSAADSICMDGHVVNKIGTLQIAIIAKYYGIPYFVSGIPDWDYQSISQIKIEERDPQQVLEFRGVKHTMDGVKGYYPSFDITPPHLVSGVVTDQGIFSPYDLKRYYDKKVEAYY